MANEGDRQFLTSETDFWILETRKFHYATVYADGGQILSTLYPPATRLAQSYPAVTISVHPVATVCRRDCQSVRGGPCSISGGISPLPAGQPPHCSRKEPAPMYRHAVTPPPQRSC